MRTALVLVALTLAAGWSLAQVPQTAEPPPAQGPFRPRPRPEPAPEPTNAQELALFRKVRGWIDQRIDERRDELAERTAVLIEQELADYDPDRPQGTLGVVFAGFVARLVKTALLVVIGAVVTATLWALVVGNWQWLAGVGSAIVAAFAAYVEWRVRAAVKREK